MSDASQSTSQFVVLPKILNGCIAGIIGIACIFPIDLVKTRLQNQPIGPNGEVMYKSIIDAFRKVYRQEGFFKMYKGSSVNILLVGPEKSLKLIFNDYFRFVLTSNDGGISLLNQTIAGALAGAMQLIISSPMELLKIRMQDAGRVSLQDGKNAENIKHLSASKMSLNLIREKGIFGFYQGVGAAALRDISFSAIYFPLFFTINERGPLRKDGTGEAVTWWSLVAGLGSGSISALTVTPFDVIKTRIQADPDKKIYKGIIHCILQTIQEEKSFLSFFKGGLCRIMVIAPLYGITQAIYYFGMGEYILGIEKPKIN